MKFVSFISIFLSFICAYQSCEASTRKNSMVDILIGSLDIDEMNAKLQVVERLKLNAILCRKEIKFLRVPAHCYGLSSLSEKNARISGANTLLEFRSFLNDCCRLRASAIDGLAELEEILSYKYISKRCRKDLTKRLKILGYKIRGQYLSGQINR